MVNRHDNGVCLRSDLLHVEITLERKEMGLFDDMRNMIQMLEKWPITCRDYNREEGNGSVWRRAKNWTFTTILIAAVSNIIMETFFFNFGWTLGYFWGHWYPCFGLLVTSPLGFKAKVGSALFALGGGVRDIRPLRFTSAFLFTNISRSISCHFLWSWWWRYVTNRIRQLIFLSFLSLFKMVSIMHLYLWSYFCMVVASTVQYSAQYLLQYSTLIGPFHLQPIQEYWLAQNNHLEQAGFMLLQSLLNTLKIPE